MKGLGKILRYLKNYKKYAIINVIANAFSIVFNVFSLVAVIPFLDVLFPSKDSVNQTVNVANKPEFHFSKVNVRMPDSSKYYTQLLTNKYEPQFVLSPSKDSVGKAMDVLTKPE